MANPNPDQSGLNRRGRPKGSRNRAIVARESAASAAMVEISKGLAAPEIANLSPLDLMLTAMRAYAAGGNLDAALSCAQMAAPFCHARMSPAGDDGGIPPELMPDPKPTPDEEGPEHPIY